MKILLKRIVCLLIISILTILSLSNIAFADASSNYDVGAFEKKSSGSAGTSIENFAGGVLYIIKIVAVGVGLIMLTVLAMKYMLASANDRAAIKQSAVVYITGAVIMFSAAGILQIIQTFTDKNLSAS